MRFASRDIYIRNGSERFNTECSLAPFGHYFVSSTTSIHQEVWKIQAVCARIQLLEFKMPKLVFVQSQTHDGSENWLWVGLLSCVGLSPLPIRASTGTTSCSFHAQVIQVSQHPHSCSERNKRDRNLKIRLEPIQYRS